MKAVLFCDRENISEKIEVFHLGLKMLFGSGAIAIEDVIVRGLFAKLDLKFSWKDTFVNLVEKARTYFAYAR